jgi:hypothetical protein
MHHTQNTFTVPSLQLQNCYADFLNNLNYSFLHTFVLVMSLRPYLASVPKLLDTILLKFDMGDFH